MYDFKHRFWALIGVLFFLALSLAISFAGIDSFRHYITYPKSVIFSTWTVFAIFFPTFSIPFLILISPVIFHGRMISINVGKNLMRISFSFLMFTILLMIGFSSVYTSSLMNKGYVQCSSVPIGWTPGMASKYVLDIADCRNSR